MANTIHALANVGKAIIVGRGGVYATADLPHGIHLRLVAQLEYRVDYLAHVLKVSLRAASAEVQRRDREREAFHRRYYPGKTMLGEMFTLTLNSAALTNQQMISCILPLILEQPTAGAVANAAC